MTAIQRLKNQAKHPKPTKPTQKFRVMKTDPFTFDHPTVRFISSQVHVLKEVIAQIPILPPKKLPGTKEVSIEDYFDFYFGKGTFRWGAEETPKENFEFSAKRVWKWEMWREAYEAIHYLYKVCEKLDLMPEHPQFRNLIFSFHKTRPYQHKGRYLLVHQLDEEESLESRIKLELEALSKCVDDNMSYIPLALWRKAEMKALE